MSEPNIGAQVTKSADVPQSPLPSASPERPPATTNGQLVAVAPSFIPVAQIPEELTSEFQELFGQMQSNLQPLATDAVTTARDLRNNPAVLSLENDTRDLLARTLDGALAVFDNLPAGPDKVLLRVASDRFHDLKTCVANAELPISDCEEVARQAKQAWENAKNIVQNPAVQMALGLFDLDILANGVIALSEGNILGALGCVVEWGVWQGIGLGLNLVAPGAGLVVKEGLQTATKVIGKEIGEQVVKHIAGNLGEKVGEELLDDLFGDLLKGAAGRLEGLALEGAEVRQEALARDFQQIFRERVFGGLIGPDGNATEELGTLIRQHLNAEALTEFVHNGKKLGPDAIEALQQSDELVEQMTDEITANVMSQVDDLLEQRGLTTASFREYLTNRKGDLDLTDEQVERVTGAFTEGKDRARQELRDAVEAQVRRALDDIRGRQEEDDRGSSALNPLRADPTGSFGIEYVEGTQTPTLANNIVPFSQRFNTTTAYAMQVGSKGTLEQVLEDQVTGIKTT